MATTKKRGAKAALLMFMQDNPGKAVSAEVMLAGIPGYERSALLQSAAIMVNEFPGNMNRIASGVYMWTPTPEVTNDGVVEGHKFVADVIIASANGSAVLRAGDQLYRLVPIEL